MFSGVGKGPTGVIKSILDTSRTEGKAREEIFVDIVEKISCTFSSSGHVQTSQIDGAIQVSSLLLCSTCMPFTSCKQVFHGPFMSPATPRRRCHHASLSLHIALVQVKSYLTGNPAIAIALNDSLVIGRRETSGSVNYGGYGRGGDTVMLDDCNFHQSVSLEIGRAHV